jgi:hypothetical protein
MDEGSREWLVGTIMLVIIMFAMSMLSISCAEITVKHCPQTCNYIGQQCWCGLDIPENNMREGPR